MSNLLPRFPDDAQQKPKSFWKRPEGKTGALFLVGGAAALTYFAGPFIIALFGTLVTMLGQAIAITVLGAVLALLVMIVSNKRVHTIINLLFQRSMRWLTGWVIELDPINIMRSYIEDLTKKQGVIDESIESLNGQYMRCQQQIDSNAEVSQNEMHKARLAKQRGQTTAATISARHAMRLQDMNDKKLKPLAEQMQAHLKMLRKYSEVTTIIRTDLTNEINIQEQQRSMITTSFNAITAAKRIIQGGHDERMMFDQAMEFVAQDYNMKLGAIDNFIENTKHFMDSMDLQNGVFEEQAMARLAEWEKQADELLKEGQSLDEFLGLENSKNVNELDSMVLKAGTKEKVRV